jgi:transposase
MGIIESQLRLDPLGGDIFIFANRRRTIAKVLLWNGTGIAIYMKRLERGRFAELWRRHHTGALQLTSNELALFLEGSPYAGRQPLSPAVIPARILAV